MADLAPGRPRLFRFERGGESLGGIVVSHDGELHVYVNRCPHVGYSLDFGDDKVMAPEGQFLMCYSHGARFLPESGECFMGPAYGLALEQLSYERDGDDLIVAITPEPDDWMG